MKISDLSPWNHEHRDLVILNVRAKLIGLGHTPKSEDQPAWSLDRKLVCTTCGYMAFLHGNIVASPIIGITCQEAQEKLSKAASMPRDFVQRHSMQDFNE